jgi:hypothetical protein
MPSRHSEEAEIEVQGTIKGWMVSATPRPLYSQEGEPVPIVQEAGWESVPVWKGQKNSRPPGFEPQTLQPVAIL